MKFIPSIISLIVLHTLMSGGIKQISCESGLVSSLNQFKTSLLDNYQLNPIQFVPVQFVHKNSSFRLPQSNAYQNYSHHKHHSSKSIQKNKNHVLEPSTYFQSSQQVQSSLLSQTSLSKTRTSQLTDSNSESSSSHQHRNKYILNPFLEEFPCRELFSSSFAPNLLACVCSRDSINGAIINCDQIPAKSDLTLWFKNGKNLVHSYSQRNSGLQSLNGQLFAKTEYLTLLKLDFSNNLLRSLKNKAFDGVEHSLLELNLNHNYLGDQLNPIYSTNEFFELKTLRRLNLAHNMLRALDSNIFTGLHNLTELYLQGNQLTNIPVSSLNPLNSLTKLNVGYNLITNLQQSDFPKSLTSLIQLNLTGNQIKLIAENTFVNLKKLSELYLSGNKLKSLNKLSNDLKYLEVLDLSDNLFDSIPFEAIADFKRLRKLNLASNFIFTIEETDFINLHSLKFLDLSKNFINTVASSQVFNTLTELKMLSLATNSLSKLSDYNEDLFKNQKKLEILDLSDNSLSSFPYFVLSTQNNLKKLFLDYNLIEDLSNEMLHPLINLEELSLSYNLISELKNNLFLFNSNLKLLNLHGNNIQNIQNECFTNIAENLLALDLGYNDLKEVPYLNMSKLIILNLSLNKFKQISKDNFSQLPNLRHFNLTYNEISELPFGIFNQNKFLEILDLSKNQLKYIDNGVFKNLSFTHIYLSENKIKEIYLSAFEDLFKLEHLDLHSNQINLIKNGAFDDLPHLKTLDLSSNKLNSFKGEYFTTRTHLQNLNLCNNQITYLYSNSFVIHRKLKTLLICENKLSYFPAEILNTIRTLEKIDLNKNKLQSLDSNDFANMPQLKSLNLSKNQLSFIGPNVFHNSTLLQYLDLSDNKLISLHESIFKNILKLSLDLSKNQLSTLKNDLFEFNNVFMLESLNLSGNNFTTFPTNALIKHHTWLEYLNISDNLITYLPTNSDLLVNIKNLDISSNPLLEEAIITLFNEPKSARQLYASSINLNFLKIKTIEMPFLRVLDLSKNNISTINSRLFNRMSLLEDLNLSSNQLYDHKINLNELWSKLQNLKKLNFSNNFIQYITKEDFKNLSNLKVFDISNQKKLIKFDCESIAKMHQLNELYIYGYPKLNVFEIQECFPILNNKLSILAIELKQEILQGHLQKAFSNKLEKLMIMGKQLTTLSSNALFGIKSKQLKLVFTNTSIHSIPLNFFSSLPMQCEVSLKIANQNELPAFNSDLLEILSSKQINVKLIALENVSITCDCQVEPLWKLIRSQLIASNSQSVQNSLTYSSFINNYEYLNCTRPANLFGYGLLDLELNEFSCYDDASNDSSNNIYHDYTDLVQNNKKENNTNLEKSSITFAPNADLTYKISSTQVPSSSTPSTINRKPIRKSYLATSKVLNQRNNRQITSASSSILFTKMDTLIVGTMAGVIGFVCVLLIIVCVIRVKTVPIDHCRVLNSPNGSQYAHQMQIRSPSAAGSCTCLKSACQQAKNASYYAPHFPNNLSNIGPYYSEGTLRAITMLHMK